ncbi:MAG: RICIN domain-containing protein [Faecalicoccus sp.]|nr:RICIN domain-containing protein [Faecalicoccus sp.]
MKKYLFSTLLAGAFLTPAAISTIYADEQIEVQAETEDPQLEVQEEIEENQQESQNEFIPEISAEAHVSNVGWMEPEVIDDSQNEIMVGTTGRSQSMEALIIEADDPEIAKDIEYISHVANIGWEQEWKNAGEMTGTTGRGYAIEAIQIRLKDELSETYDIYYQPHVSNVGWLGWAKNGEKAGSAGHGYALEALRIALYKKGSFDQNIGGDSFLGSEISVTSHVSNIGWMPSASEGQITGTVGMSNSMEAIQIQLDHADYEGSVEYQSYVHGIGWEDTWHSDNEMSGTTGQSRYIEAIRLRLNGQMAENYNIYYQAHVSRVGWMDWTCNGNNAGSIGFDNSIEALRIMLEKKNGTQHVEAGTDAFRNNRVAVTAHVSNVGWMAPVSENQVSGTVGLSNSIEGLIITLNDTEYTGGILYKTYVQSIGWEKEWRTSGELSGTTGQSKHIEAIQMVLTGQLANVYDIYYQAHVANIGWMHWSVNGNPAGSTGYNYGMEALKIRLVKKGEASGLSTANAYVEDILKVRSHASAGWTGYKTSGDITGNYHPIDAVQINAESSLYDGSVIYKTYGEEAGWQSSWTTSGNISSQKYGIEAIQIALTGELANRYDIYYQTHVNSIGWLGFASNGDCAGTENYGEAIDALRIILVEKGKPYPVSDAQAYFVRPDAAEFAKAHSQDVADGEYYIVDAKSGIYYLNYSDEGYPAIYTFNNTDPDKWIISHDSRGFVLVKHKETGEYLSVGNDNSRTVPRWVFVKDEDGYILLPEAAIENHLSITGNSFINGNSLTTALSTDKDLCHWKLVDALDVQSMLKDLARASEAALKDGVYEIVNNGNQSIAIAANSQNQSGVQMQILSDSDNQYWQIEHDDQGYATIFSKGAQKYLAVGEKDVVGLSDQSGKIEAKWIILPTASGYQIISAANPYAVLMMNESKGYAGNTLVSEEADLTLANTWCLFTRPYSTIRRETMGRSYDMDGWYGAQCWDYVDYVMIHYYGSYNGVSCSTTGYVQDIATNKEWNGILNFMDDVTGQEMEQGDIVVWGFCDACPYSHIALYDRQGVGDKIYVLGQNQPYPYVNVLSVSKEGVIGVFRPKKIYNV